MKKPSAKRRVFGGKKGKKEAYCNLWKIMLQYHKVIMKSIGFRRKYCL